MDTQMPLFIFLCFVFLHILSGHQGAQVSAAHHHHHHHRRHHHHHHPHGSHNNMYGFRPSKLFVFGDSYADTGNNGKSEARSWKVPYGVTFPGKPAGRFSDGRVLTDYIAKFVGVKSPIPYRWRKHGAKHLKNGMNFAYGGTGVFETLYPEPNMTTQIDFFQNLINQSLYTTSDLQSSVALVSLAGNDYTAYVARNGSAQGFPSFITQIINQLALNLERIHGLGVKKVAVTGLEPLGCLPDSTAKTSFQQCNGTQNNLVNFHNLLLHQAVAKLNNQTKDSAFLILDLYSSFMSVFKKKGDHPGSSKFENPLKPCCVGISKEYSCGSVDESGAKKYTVCDDPQSAFFWDTVHPSQAGWSAVYWALQDTLQEIF